MANVTRWNPFAELEEMLDRYSRGSTFPRLGSRTDETGRDLMQRADWAPAVDISEDKEAFYIHAELPGVKKDDIKVNVQDGVLTLQGERRDERDVEEEKRHRIERFYGSFARSFTLPENVDEEGVEAQYKDGVLNLKLKKTEKSKPRSIDVKVD
ncbi:Hsp20/alpha crystallin family protein [Marinobacteraceae bacterium S3BR75-40.1]